MQVLYEKKETNILKTIYLFRHSKPDRNFKGCDERMPLSEEGRGLLQKLLEKLKPVRVQKIFASPYLRAYETAMAIGENVIKDDRLIERKIGRKETFTKETWLKQYTDCDFSNEGGESFRAVRSRMTEAINEILEQMAEGEAVAIVSHAAAICAYLQQFCEIEVTDADKKYRKIQYKDKVLLEGEIHTPSCFKLIFESGLSDISYFH